VTETLTRLAVRVFVVGMLLVWAVPSQAYRMIQNRSVGRVSAGGAASCDASIGFVHWENQEIEWFVNPPAKAGTQVARKSAAALTAATKAWTDAGTEHVLTVAGTTTAGFAVDNRNTISWAKGNGCTGTCLAITSLVLQAGQVIVESDISFNAARRWQTTGKGLDIQTTATHELGHSLGIHHTEVMSAPRPSMFTNYFGVEGRSLEEDDRAALRCSESRY
jgi:Matrixin